MKLLPNEILIHGTKTKLSIRTLPIMPPLRPILEKLIKGRNKDEQLFPFSTVVIRNFHRVIKEKTKIKFTLKDYRHTCATNFKDAGIPVGAYFRWFGWSNDSMARKVYTHETDYEKRVSQKWAEKFTN
jgi:integrase